MFSKSASVFINASPEAVYDYVSDIGRHPEWAHERLDISVGDKPSQETGATFEYVTHFMGDAAGKGVVTEASRPGTFSYEVEDKDGRYRWTFDIKAEGNGTRLTHRMLRLKAPAYFTVIQPILYPILGKKQVVGGLGNIKAKLEAAG
jgi:uncharacterized protein YndB with AHSA1/START domain